jgi:hypothetical protein
MKLTDNMFSKKMVFQTWLEAQHMEYSLETEDRVFKVKQYDDASLAYQINGRNCPMMSHWHLSVIKYFNLMV